MPVMGRAWIVDDITLDYADPIPDYNTILNPSFDDSGGSLDHWTVARDVSLEGAAGTDTYAPPHGVACAYLYTGVGNIDNYTGFSSLYQAVRFNDQFGQIKMKIANNFYTIMGWGYAPNGVTYGWSKCEIMFEAGGSDHVVYTWIPPSEDTGTNYNWENITITKGQIETAIGGAITTVTGIKFKVSSYRPGAL
jgi:hypothetical protein